jgi:hypothetical protein
MATYVHDQNGVLVSWNQSDTDPVAPADVLAANGLTAVSGLPPLDATHVWDPVTKTVLTVAAPVLPNEVKTADWIMQFTPAEHQVIDASTDAAVRQFLFALQCAPTIDLNNPMIGNGLAYLVSLSLLTEDRATALQTWTEPQ